MTLTDKAVSLRREMREAAALRQECFAVDEQYRCLLQKAMDGEDVDYGLLGFLSRERSAYRRALAARRVKNWAILSRGRSRRDLGVQVLSLRYGQGLSWRTMARILGQRKRTILEAHDEALNRLAEEMTE